MENDHCSQFSSVMHLYILTKRLKHEKNYIFGSKKDKAPETVNNLITNFKHRLVNYFPFELLVLGQKNVAKHTLVTRFLRLS